MSIFPYNWRKQRTKLIQALREEPTTPNVAWEGTPKEYEIVRYRDDTFRIIEERIRVTSLNHLSPAIAQERADGHPGRLNRHIGNKVTEVTSWT